jgi:hypothetical protein
MNRRPAFPATPIRDGQETLMAGSTRTLSPRQDYIRLSLNDWLNCFDVN